PGLCRLDRVEGYRGRVGAGARADEVGPDPLRPDPELIDRAGAEGVARGEEDSLATALETIGELADRRRLADAVHTHDQVDGRGRVGLLQRGIRVSGVED